MENLGYGFLLMVVGMTTVFLILMIVIGLGKALIRAVNRFFPETVGEDVRPTVVSVGSVLPNAVSGGIIAAIVSAIGVTTGGKGNVISIEKRNE
ncbi:MAG: OadG family protein [Tannerella sp.]|jgi:oxaloacetate decarboxylase gamma subunit|nr:OadG family protein [Tannerella sp.]